jgi:hypothetical protein
MANPKKSESKSKQTDAEQRPKGYASETKVSELQSVGTFPQGKGNAPSAGELAERGRRNAEAQNKDDS